MSILLNPKKYRDRNYPDTRSKEIMLKTIQWFEEKGLARQKEQFHDKEFCKDFRISLPVKVYLKPFSFPKDMVQIPISITVLTECMNSQKSVVSMGLPIGTLIMCRR
jgi:hypothetical protein